MANQQPRPAWFRLSSLAGRAPAPARPPAPAVAPVRQPAPVPTVMRPPIPTRPVVPPMQTQEPAPPRPQSPVAAPPAAAPPQPSPPPPAPARSPVATAPSSRTQSPAAPQPSSLRAAPASSQPSPPLPLPAPAPAPTAAPPQPSFPAAPASRSSIPGPPPATKSPLQRSPVPKEASTTSTDAPPSPPSPETKTAPFSQSPTPAPAPATKSPLQRSPIAKETSTTSTDAPPAPSSPETKTTPSSAMPTSPVPKAAEMINGKAAAMPVPSPKVVKSLERTPVQSPKLKPASHPPSPFTLPPAQVAADHGEREPETKIDQKNVLVQESIDKPMNKHRTHNNAVPSNGKREPMMKDKGPSKKVYDSEELGMRMITLAGENKGAVMELTPSPKKTYFPGNPHSLQKQQAGTKSGTSNGDQSTGENDEGKSGSKDKTNRSVTMQSPMKGSLNSNVQGLNNSILFNCTFRNSDPGIHLSLTRKVNGGYSRTNATDK